MIKHKRATIERYRKSLEKIRIENEAKTFSSKNIVIYGPSKTSLNFDFRNSLEYKPYLTLYGKSKYFQEAINLILKWKSQNSWRRAATEKRKDQLLCLVANLLLISRTSFGKSIRQPLSLNVTQNKHFYEVIQILMQKKCINYFPGYSFKDGKSDTSKIYPTIKFDNIFPPIRNEYDLNFHVTVVDSELIRMMRNKKRVNLSPTNKMRTEGISNKLVKINHVNLSHKIGIRLSNHEYPCCTKLCAVFNKNVNRGGRLYASGLSYQTEPKKNRAKIYIDDEPTIELDYSGLHPRMLYAKKGIQYHGDIYDLKGLMPEYSKDSKLRKLSKLGLLILINAINDKNITGILANYVWEEHRKLAYHLNKKYQTAGEGVGIYSRTIKALIEKHLAIAEYFYSDEGVHLQNKDGKMAIWICDTFAKKEIPILPVHDSFIVQERFEGLLMKTMNEGYAKYNNGLTCPIDYANK